MNDLEKYYAKFSSKHRNMPDFSVLNDSQKKVLENSLGFAIWKLGRAKQKFIDSIKKMFA